jgi:RES domain-containing protein
MVAYSNRRDLRSGTGSRLHGARWNPPGRFNVLYASLAAETAIAESLGTSNGFGVPPAQARPRVFAVFNFELQHVLDVSSAKVIAALGIDYDVILGEDWKARQDAGVESLSQSIGRIAWQLRLEGIVVPSAVARHERNIALFPSRRRRGSSWRIAGARDLPRSR